jgi:uncharacterized protein YndB with AHSA1/START domain
MPDQQTWVRIERAFNAPIEHVWRMWTEPGLFQQWYGPLGMNIPTAEMDVGVGATRKICMKMKSGERVMCMWFTGVYKEVSRPNRLGYVESMRDADGTILSPQSMGMPAGHPDITEVIIDLRSKDGRTLMTMVHVGVPVGSAGTGGWNQAFEKLAEKHAK